MATSVWETLPAELFSEVTGHIKDTKTLAALSIVSQRFHVMTEPSLYSSITQFGQERRLRLFLRTVLEAPHLALLVKKLSVQPYRGRIIGIHPSKDDPSPGDENNMRNALLLCALAEEQSITSIIELHRQQPDSSWEPLIAILLCLLSSLEELELYHYGYSNGRLFIESTFLRAAQIQSQSIEASSLVAKIAIPKKAAGPLKVRNIFPSLNLGISRLRKITFWCHTDPRFAGMISKYIRPLLTLPSIISVQAHLLDGFPELFPGDVVPSNLDIKISHLRVHQSAGTRPDALQRFFASFSALKTLDFVFNYNRFNYTHNLLGFIPPEIVLQIGHLHGSLEQLSIMQGKYSPVVDDPGPGQSVYSLLKFEKLKVLKVPADVLLGRPRVRRVGPPGHEILKRCYDEVQIGHFCRAFPVSLQHLTIYECCTAISAPILQSLSGKTPWRIKTIELQFDSESELKGFCEYEPQIERLLPKDSVLLTTRQRLGYICSPCWYGPGSSVEQYLKHHDSRLA